MAHASKQKARIGPASAKLHIGLVFFRKNKLGISADAKVVVLNAPIEVARGVAAKVCRELVLVFPIRGHVRGPLALQCGLVRKVVRAHLLARGHIRRRRLRRWSRCRAGHWSTHHPTSRTNHHRTTHCHSRTNRLTSRSSKLGTNLHGGFEARGEPLSTHALPDLHHAAETTRATTGSLALVLDLLLGHALAITGHHTQVATAKTLLAPKGFGGLEAVLQGIQIFVKLGQRLLKRVRSVLDRHRKHLIVRTKSGLDHSARHMNTLVRRGSRLHDGRHAVAHQVVSTKETVRSR